MQRSQNTVSTSTICAHRTFWQCSNSIGKKLPFAWIVDQKHYIWSCEWSHSAHQEKWQKNSLETVMSETRTGPGPKSAKAKTRSTPRSTGPGPEDSNTLPWPKPVLAGYAGRLLHRLHRLRCVGWLCSRMIAHTEQERLRGHGWKILVALHLYPPAHSPSPFLSVLPSSTSVTLAMGRGREAKSNEGMGREVRGWQLIVWPLGESERLRGRETRDPRKRERENNKVSLQGINLPHTTGVSVEASWWLMPHFAYSGHSQELAYRPATHGELNCCCCRTGSHLGLNRKQ